MKVTIENKELVIRIPVNDPPTPSKSGKTLIVATTSGNQKLPDVVVGGKPLVLGLTAYIAR